MGRRVTLTEATTFLNLYNTAITAIVTGKAQSYTIGGRAMTYVDLPKLEELRDKYQRIVNALNATTGGTSRNPIFGARG